MVGLNVSHFRNVGCSGGGSHHHNEETIYSLVCTLVEYGLGLRCLLKKERKYWIEPDFTFGNKTSTSLD